MDTFTTNTYTNYYNKKSLNTKTKDELIDLYINDFDVKPNAQAKLLTKIKTKDDIIKLILTQRDAQYTKLIKKKYGTHKDEYSGLCNGFTTGELNDETKSVRDRIHAIHDFIRNKGFGYGMTGLKLFNLFYGLLQIEKSGLLQKWTFSAETLENTNLTNEELITKLSFEKIFSIVNSYDDVRDKETDKYKTISDLITNLCELLRKFGKGKDARLKNLIYYDLSHIKANAIDMKTLLNLIKELDELTTSSNIQLGGKIYEYFVGRDQSAISELGAYFTDRHLVNYIFKNILDIENTIDIDNLPKVCDMFGGSGGFTINFIVYVNDILKKKLKYSQDDIYKFWEGKNIKKVNHYDVNQDVVNNAKLEAFCLTHQLIGKGEFGTRNSFTHSYTNGDKYDLIISNPPYGGDKAAETSKMKEYNTIIEYNKNLLYNDFDDDMTQEQRSKLLIQNVLLEAEIKYLKDEQKKKCINYASCSKFIRDYCDKITDFENDYLISNGKKGNKKRGDGFNDKESCSFVLLMALCATSGRVLGVLKEGVFFDKKYTHIRRYLLKNFIVKRIDSNPSDAFENTTTKTSNILFELPKEGESVPDDYNVKFYDVKVIKNTEDAFKSRDNFTLLNSASNGTIKEVKSINEKTVSVETILDNDECSLNSKQYDNKPLVAGKGFKMVKLEEICEFLPKSKRLASFSNNTGKYRFYSSGSKILKCNTADYKDKYILIIGHSGDGCLFIDNEFSTLLTNHLLYIKDYEKLKYIYYNLKSIWTHFYYTCYDGSTVKNTSDKNISKYKVSIPESDEQLQYWVNHISEPFNKIQDNKSRLTILETKVQTDIQNILDNNECEEVMLGDLCEFNNNNLKTKLNYINYIDISSIENNKIKEYKYLTSNYPSRAKRIVKYNDILYSSVRPNLKNYTLFTNKLNNNYICSTGFIVLSQKNINNRYIYYNLIKEENTNYIISNASGSNYPSINDKVLKQIKIQLPKDRTILDTLNPVFDEIDSLNEELPKQEELYQSRLEELRKAAILED
jgi:restriction endonuclease S subunit